MVVMNDYLRRDIILLQLDYRDYSTYLESGLWKSIRRRQLKRHPKCVLCDFPANQVHHKTYSLEVILGEVPACNSALVSICRICHVGIEYDQKSGYKLTLDQANNKLQLGILSGSVPHKSPKKKPKRQGKKKKKGQKERRCLNCYNKYKSDWKLKDCFCPKCYAHGKAIKGGWVDERLPGHKTIKRALANARHEESLVTKENKRLIVASKKDHAEASKEAAKQVIRDSHKSQPLSPLSKFLKKDT